MEGCPHHVHVDGGRGSELWPLFNPQISDYQTVVGSGLPGGPHAVSEVQALQKLYQTLNK
jgi:hypothetical protein